MNRDIEQRLAAALRARAEQVHTEDDDFAAPDHATAVPTMRSRRRATWIATPLAAAAVVAVVVTSSLVYRADSERPSQLVPTSVAPPTSAAPLPTVPNATTLVPSTGASPLPTPPSRSRTPSGTTRSAMPSSTPMPSTVTTTRRTRTTPATAATSTGRGGSRPVSSVAASASRRGGSVTSHPGTSSAAASASAPARTTTTAAPSTASTRSTTRSAAAIVPRCTGGQVATSRGAQGGADSNMIIQIEFVNTSAAACSLTGYPSVIAYNSSGDPVGTAVPTLGGYSGRCGCSAPPTVVLAARGGQASASFEARSSNATGGGGSACYSAAGVGVTVPGTGKTVRLATGAQTYNCAMEVHPVIAGTTGGAAI